MPNEQCFKEWKGWAMSNAVDRLSKQNHWNNNTDDLTSGEGKSLIKSVQQRKGEQKLEVPRRNLRLKRFVFMLMDNPLDKEKLIMEDGGQQYLSK